MTDCAEKSISDKNKPADVLVERVSFKSHWAKECDRGVLVVEHVLSINDPNTCNGKASNNIFYFDLLPLVARGR